MKSISLLTLALAFALPTISLRAADGKPLRVLLITGGCCHDYAKQKDILKKGIESRANIQVTQVHTDDKSTKPPLAILGDADYAKGYDAIIHDECAADVSDPAVIAGVLAPHRQGIPGVNLHCAMHSYRVGNPGTKATNGTPRSAWFDYLGLQSSSHGPQEPIALDMLGATHPITKGMTNWTTIREELYNNVQIFSTATPLIRGKQTVKQKDGSTKDVETVVAWINQYDKTRVFNTTVGHNSDTVADPRYLDLVTRGLLWSCGKLGPDGQPAVGYGPTAN
jgi:Trehalose utilisation